MGKLKGRKLRVGMRCSLDLSGSAPIEVKVLEFTPDGVKTEYLNSTPGRTEILSYEMFFLNGYWIEDDESITCIIKDICDKDIEGNPIPIRINKNKKETSQFEFGMFFYLIKDGAGFNLQSKVLKTSIYPNIVTKYGSELLAFSDIQEEQEFIEFVESLN